MPEIQVDPNYNPFEKKEKKEQASMHFPFRRESKVDNNWEKLYTDSEHSPETEVKGSANRDSEAAVSQEKNHGKIFQLHEKYIISQIKTGFIIIHQERAHQRILIDRLEQQLKAKKASSQQLLFPLDLTLSAEEELIFNELQAELEQIGFDIRSFGKGHFIIRGVPPEANNLHIKSILEALIDEFRQSEQKAKNRLREKMISSLAKGMSIKVGKILKQVEMLNLIDELFACKMPYHLPNGLPTVIKQSMEELDRQFKRK